MSYCSFGRWTSLGEPLFEQRCIDKAWSEFRSGWFYGFVFSTSFSKPNLISAHQLFSQPTTLLDVLSFQLHLLQSKRFLISLQLIIFSFIYLHFNVYFVWYLIDCNQKLRNALFLVGEIGGNDYNYALFQGKTIQEVKDMVPQVVQTIKNAVEVILGIYLTSWIRAFLLISDVFFVCLQKVISYGATRVVVPGNFPIGCLPIYLTGFQTNDTTAYDELHCLKDLNGLATYHNDQIKQAIEVLKRENPHTVIVYGDYYNALLWILRRAFTLGMVFLIIISLIQKNWYLNHSCLLYLGFDEASLQKSCCGIGGDYNFSLMKMCGVGGVSVCSNPDERVSWDGIHFTQKAYKFMADWLIQDILPQLHCIVWILF